MKNTGQKALVLIGTCNGERFLLDQIESILRQEGGTLHILIRDDHSDDATPEMLTDLEHRHANIEVITDDLGRLGYAQNFSLLMREACRREPKYILFSDQDDIWHPQRLARQVQTLRRMEQATGAATPCLAHSDLQLIDEQGHLISDSLFREQGIRIPGPDQSLAQLLAANFVTGCTIAINSALLELAMPVPAVIRNHDHWLGLCAAACGRIESETEALVQYRQHGENAIGGASLPRSLLLEPRRLIDKLNRHREDIRRLHKLIQVLQERCEASGTASARALLSHAQAATCSGPSRTARYRALKRLGIHPAGFQRSLLWLLRNIIA